VTYDVTALYDSRYTNAEVVYCAVTQDLTNAPFSHLCVVKIEDTLLLPILSPYESNCVGCSSVDDVTLDNYNCNEFDMIAGYVFSPQTNLVAGLLVLMDTYALYGMQEIKRGFSQMVANESNVIFDYCVNCTVFWLNIWDDFGYVTPYAHSIYSNGHCQDSVSSPNYFMLGQTSPVKLSEQWFECQYSVADSFFFAVR
jgi:hypothetical protein